MLYHFFHDLNIEMPGVGLWNYISFRAGLALILSLFISTIIGKRIIDYLRQKQMGELVRNLGLEGENTKKGTPTMGGIIIIISILLPCFLVGRFDSLYMILMLITTVWLGLLGYADDYIKVVKKDKEGMHGKFKIIGQVGLGLIVGLTLYFNPDFVIRENVEVVGTNGTEIEYQKEDIKSITLKGIEGLAKIQEILETFRTNPPKKIGAYDVVSARDYKKDTIVDLATGETKATGLPSSNVLYYDLTDDAWVCVRPSGTEPKIKIYYGIKGTSLQDADEKSAALGAEVKKLIDAMM